MTQGSNKEVVVGGPSDPGHVSEEASSRSVRAMIGDRIRSFREGLKLSQKALAELADLGSHQIVSQIEQGERDVKALELARLGRVLHASMDVLLGTAEPSLPARVLWRRRSVERDLTREAQLVQRARSYAKLEDWCGQEPSEYLPDYDIDPSDYTYAEASALASRVGQILNLGRIPAGSLESTLAERFGVKVFYDHLGVDGSASAACVRDDDVFGSAVLLNADEVPVRRAFSLAHELFHLVTWASIASEWQRVGRDGGEPEWYAQLERCAQAFAAALVIPADDLVVEMSRRGQGVEGPMLPPAEYAFIARTRFGVSTDALLWRLVNVRLLSHEQREELVQHPEIRATRRPNDAGDVSTFPDRFWELVRLAYEREQAGVAKLAEIAEISVGEMYDFLTSPVMDADYQTSARESTQLTAV